MSEKLDNKQSLALIIGTLGSEGIRSTLYTAGLEYKIKRLDSSVDNWESIISYFDEFKIFCSVIKLTGYIYEYLVDPKYVNVRDLLLDRLTDVPHVIFIHEALFSDSEDKTWINEEELDEAEYLYRQHAIHQPALLVRNEVNSLLATRGLNILSYKYNSELTVMASTFITEMVDGLLFRVYIPIGRLWANETDRLLQLFRDYLAKVGHVSVRLDQHRTEHGIAYEFYSAKSQEGTTEIIQQSLATQFQEFSHLLDLSISNPAQAEEILRSKQVNANEVVQILTRYAKEAKRIQIDLRHEREQKVLSIRQRLESELTDILPTDIKLETIGMLADSVVPPMTGIGSALSNDQRQLQLTATQGGSININLNPQMVQAVNSIVAQEIDGDLHLAEMDKNFFNLFVITQVMEQ